MDTTWREAGCERGAGEYRVWFDRGVEALSASRPEEAEKCFDMVLRTDPFNARAHTGLGNAYWEQGRTEDALNSVTRALEIEPNDRETILVCSRIFDALGKKDYSLEVLQSYLARNPLDETVHAEIQKIAGPGEPPDAEAADFFRKQGEIRYKGGNLDHAIACYEMAIESNPGLAEAHSDLGVIHWERGNLESALEYFYKALELKSDDPEILGNCARALARAGETDSAAALFRQYLQHCPKDDGAWDDYEALIRQSAGGRWSAEGLSASVADIYVDAAKRLKDAGDLAGAAEAVEKALKIGPEASEALFVLASLHNAIGQNEEAETVLDRALQADPGHAESSALLKRIRNGNGNGSRA